MYAKNTFNYYYLLIIIINYTKCGIKVHFSKIIKNYSKLFIMVCSVLLEISHQLLSFSMFFFIFLYLFLVIF